MPARFIQIHFLTAFPGALLNRDDAGFAKRLPFGGATRTRISSQCLKRHWRMHEGKNALSGLGVPGSVRSRITLEEKIVKPLVRDGLPEDRVRAATEALKKPLFGEKPKEAKAEPRPKKGAKKEEAPALFAEAKTTEPAADPKVETAQVTILGVPEVAFLQSLVRAAVTSTQTAEEAAKAVDTGLTRDGKANLAALQHASGLDAALFGRMVTSDVLARGDAAVHVAHAFTVHAEESEADYFSAMDDLLAETGELGSGHISHSELTSGLYYGYVVVDVPLLVSNLMGCSRKDWEKADRTLAGLVVDRLVRLIATVSPGAKKGSTAPYAYAQMMLVEAGEDQPRTLANAFATPVRAGQAGMLEGTMSALSEHVQALDGAYGAEKRRVLGVGMAATTAASLGATQDNLAGLAAWAGAQVTG